MVRNSSRDLTLLEFVKEHVFVAWIVMQGVPVNKHNVMVVRIEGEIIPAKSRN